MSDHEHNHRCVPGIMCVDVPPSAYTFADARRDTDDIKRCFRNILDWAARAAEHLAVAYQRRIWDYFEEYSTWEEYCTGEFSQVRNVKMPIAMRVEVVQALTEAGMSTREVQVTLGLGSNKTVARDLERAQRETTRYDDEDQDTDDALQAPDIPEPRQSDDVKPKPPSRTVLAKAALLKRAEDGLTIDEMVARFPGWRYQHVSPLLTRLHRQTDDQGRRSVVMLDVKRKGQTVYVLPQFVAGRPTVDGRARRAT